MKQQNAESVHIVNTRKPSSKTLMLISGGIDSTTLLAYLNQYGSPICVFFDYGQENVPPTIKSAKEQCEKYGAELLVIKLPYDWSRASIISGNFVDEGIRIDNVYGKDVKALSWVPARNAVMMLVAGGIASERGIEEVYSSFQFDTNEWAIYDALKIKSEFGAADLTPAFIENLNAISPFCYKSNVKFFAPFIDARLNCYEIVELGRSINVDYNNTYSCRYYVNGKPCGVCEQCIIREARLKA
jgi:7-cyano-7-deazaguanine synthase